MIETAQQDFQAIQPYNNQANLVKGSCYLGNFR
jgi:hypothetical protein